MNSKLYALLFDEPRVTVQWVTRFDEAWAQSGVSDKTLCEEIQRHYNIAPNATDGFSRLACVLMKHNQLAMALSLFERDASSGRQTWWQCLRHAECEACNGDLESALERVEAVYAENPKAVNGYAAIAWALREKRRQEEVLDILTKDLKAHRITPGTSLNAAIMLAESGAVSKAADLVEWAYGCDPSLCDGYAQIGAILHKQQKDAEALGFYQLDLKVKRLTASRQLVLATLLAQANQWDEASAEVAAAYAADPALQEGFVRLGNIRRAQHQYAAALDFYERDAVAGRLTPASRLIYAELLAFNDQWSKGENEVVAAYDSNPSLQEGFARLGNIRRALRQYATALDLFERDAQANRLTAASRLVFAELLARAERWPQAEAEVERSYAEDPTLKDGHIRLLGLRPFDENLSKFLEYGDRDLQKGRLSAQGPFQRTARLRAQATLQGELAAIAESMQAKLDIPGQWGTLERFARSGKCPSRPVRILDSELIITNPHDTLVQFREIVLQESYFFQTESLSPAVIDGGANIGMAIAYFKWLYPHAQITAFEPHPELFDLCCRNIAHNGWTRVTLIPCALLDHAGPVSFNILSQMPMGSSVTTRLRDALPTLTSRTIEVESCCLSDHITASIDFLKLDIEGAETRVIRQSQDRLHFIRQGFIEYHYGTHQENNSLGELLSLLEKVHFDYRLAEPPEHSVLWPQSGRQGRTDANWSCSIFFARKNE